MIKYLNADKFFDTIKLHDYELVDCINSHDRGMFTIGIKQAIDEQPAEDVQPVIHAHWIHKLPSQNSEILECSNCGVWFVGDEDFLNFIKHGNYCTHCGARMDGDKHE